MNIDLNICRIQIGPTKIEIKIVTYNTQEYNRFLCMSIDNNRIIATILTFGIELSILPSYLQQIPSDNLFKSADLILLAESFRHFLST